MGERPDWGHQAVVSYGFPRAASDPKYTRYILQYEGTKKRGNVLVNDANGDIATIYTRAERRLGQVRHLGAVSGTRPADEDGPDGPDQVVASERATGGSAGPDPGAVGERGGTRAPTRSWHCGGPSLPSSMAAPCSATAARARVRWWPPTALCSASWRTRHSGVPGAHSN